MSDTPKTIVVTGGNAGIGYATASQLAALGHHVVIVSRNPEKGEDAIRRIKEETSNDTITYVQGDLSSIASVTDLADTLRDRYPQIDVLINNAGVWMSQRELNADGLEMTFMVNHIAPYILSLRLLDSLKAAAPARIVNVNAGLFVKGECDLEKLPTGENFSKFKTYMHSKLCNVYFTNELASRLEGSGVTVNALHPGVINTNLGASSGPIGWLLSVIKKSWGTPEDGAKPIVRLAVSPEVESVNGQYFNIDEEFELTPNATDPNIQQALWTYTQDRTNIRFPA